MAQNYYLFNSGTLQRKDNSLIFRPAEGDPRTFPVENCEALYLFGEVTLNTKLLNFLSQHQITVHVFNYYDFYAGSYVPRESLLSGRVVVDQVKHYTNKKKRIAIAQKLVEGAAHNLLKNLKYYKKQGKELEKSVDLIEEWEQQIPAATEIPALMGIEGNIRNEYYRCWPIIIDQKIEFEKRVYHPPDNMINALISYCNTMVYTTCLSEIYRTQLNPLVSFLHEPGERRYSLALDLAEVFKPILSDRLIFRVLNRQQVTEKDFSQQLNFCQMNEKAIKTITREYDETLKTVIKHPSLKKQVSYRRLVRLDAYRLIKHLLGDEEYEPTKMWW